MGTLLEDLLQDPLRTVWGTGDRIRIIIMDLDGMEDLEMDLDRIKITEAIRTTDLQEDIRIITDLCTEEDLAR